MAASYLNESFEATKPTNNGYDNTWGETVGSGCTIDSDSTEVAPPTGGGSQILKLSGAGNGVTNRTSYNFGSDKSDTWSTFYFYGASVGPGDGYDTQVVSACASDSKYPWVITFRRAAGPTYNLRLQLYYNGTDNGDVDTKTISLSTWYKIDVKYDVTNTAWEWRFNDVTEGSGSLPGAIAGGMRWFEVKSIGWYADFATTFYIDRVWVDDSEYGYGDTGATNYIQLRWTK